MTKQLILVEGMPGAGKSSTTQYLAQLFRANGRPARWVEEKEAEPYFAAFWQASERQEPGLAALLLEGWRTFLHRVRSSEETVLFDAALYYAMHLMEYGDMTEVRAFVRGLYDLTRDLEVTVIFLTGEIATVFPRIAGRRGAGWTEDCIGYVNSRPYQTARDRTGLAGAVAFFQDGQALITEILAESAWDRIDVDTTEERWEEYHQTLREHFGLQEGTKRLALTRELRERYSGEYLLPEGAPLRGRLNLTLRPDGQLAMTTPYRSDLVLIPVSETRFDVQAAPLQVEFRLDPDGRVTGLLYTDFGGTQYRCTRLA